MGLYVFWCEMLEYDYGIGLLMGLLYIVEGVWVLLVCVCEVECWVMWCMDLLFEVWVDYFELVLLIVNGWVLWCVYLGWEVKFVGGSDEYLCELLVICMVWGVLLLECKDDEVVSYVFYMV